VWLPWAVRVRSLVGARSHVDPESARKLVPRAPEPVSFRGSLFTRHPPPKCLKHTAAPRCTMKAKRHAVILAAMVMVGGCQIPPPPSPSSPPQPTPMSRAEMRVSQQLIIKFKSNTIACDAAGIARVSAATQVPLRHIRPMSDDACVVQQFADNAEGLSHEQERLKQHPAIEWLEEDRMMHPFLRMGGDSRATVVEP
jgi:hypothetical protein